MTKKTIVFGITAGIAAFKMVELVKKLITDYNVEVILTKNAVSIINPSEFERLGVNVYIEMFEKDFNYKEILNKRSVEHISLSDKADLFIVSPCTANTIGKFALGMGDDLLTTSILATQAKVMICPSMNVKMWENPIVQSNLEKLRGLGYWIINPEHGDLACGYEGMGRLASISVINDEINNFFTNRSKLEGKKIVVTAGGTTEKIDPVRVISNNSSGKMGVYIAEVAAKYGADVILIKAHTSVIPNFSVKYVNVISAKDMHDAVSKNIDCDIFIHSAAVSDFTYNNEDVKIDSKQDLKLELGRTTKILDNIKKMNPNLYLVGFKAEYQITDEELVNKAFRKLKQSNADLIVANDVGKEGRGFDVDTNEVVIVDGDKNTVHLDLDSKKVIAEKIINEIISRI